MTFHFLAQLYVLEIGHLLKKLVLFIFKFEFIFQFNSIQFRPEESFKEGSFVKEWPKKVAQVT